MSGDKKSTDYYKGFYDGFKAGRADKLTPPATPAPYDASWAKCRVCGIEFKGAMGYCCMHPNCPSRVYSLSNQETL